MPKRRAFGLPMRASIFALSFSLLRSTGEFTTAHEYSLEKIDPDGHMIDFYDARGNTLKPQKLADTLCSMLAGTAPRILQVAISPTDALLESINNILVQNGRLLPNGSLPVSVVSAISGTNALLSLSSVGSDSVTSSQRELHRQELAAKDAIIAELRHQQSTSSVLLSAPAAASSSHVTIASLTAMAPTASTINTVSPASKSLSSSPFASLGAGIRKHVPIRLLRRPSSAAATSDNVIKVVTPLSSSMQRMEEEYSTWRPISTTTPAAVSSPLRPSIASLAAASPAALSHAKTVKTRGGSSAGPGSQDRPILQQTRQTRSISPLLDPSSSDDVISRHLHSPSTLQALDASLHAELHRRHSPTASAQAAVTAAVHLHTVADDSSASSDASSHRPHSAPALSRRPSFFSTAGGSFTTPAFDLFSASAKQCRSSLAGTLVGKLPLLSSRASPQDVRTHSSPPAVTIDDDSPSHLLDARDNLKRLHDALAASQAKEAATSQQLDD
jgi:hypothetical protein